MVDGGTTDARPAALCGDGLLQGTEVCDDGNGTAGDGCENDCTFSCVAATDCLDENPCNGDERCDAATHACAAGDPLVDDTACDVDRVCRAGTCAPVSCGDGALDPGEACDDGNVTPSDGCESDCTFSCTSNPDCADGEPCNGIETCDVDHVCHRATPPPDGSLCERRPASARDICLGGTCVPSRCGDGFVDDTETCDDGNELDGDGCDADCTYTCLTDRDCDDDNACNGVEACNAGMHRCVAGSSLPNGTGCGAVGRCLAGLCVVDAGPADGGPLAVDGGMMVVPDGGGAGGCVRSADCPASETCCATCPGFPGICWGSPVCPTIKCAIDGGSGM